MPLLILYGAELFLAVIGARVAIWVLRGWSEFRARERSPDEPDGPGGGLRVLPLRPEGGGAAAITFRAAA